MENAECIEYEEDLHQDADAVDIKKIICEDQLRPVFTAGTTLALNCVVYLKKAVGNPQIHLEVKGKVRVQYEGRMLDDSAHSSSGLRKSKRRKVREKIIFILPVVLSPGGFYFYLFIATLFELHVYDIMCKLQVLLKMLQYTYWCSRFNCNIRFIECLCVSFFFASVSNRRNRCILNQLLLFL